MGRGFLSGLVWGSVIFAAAVVGLAVFAPDRQPAVEETTATGSAPVGTAATDVAHGAGTGGAATPAVEGPAGVNSRQQGIETTATPPRDLPMANTAVPSALAPKEAGASAVAANAEAATRPETPEPGVAAPVAPGAEADGGTMELAAVADPGRAAAMDSERAALDLPGAAAETPPAAAATPPQAAAGAGRGATEAQEAGGASAEASPSLLSKVRVRRLGQDSARLSELPQIGLSGRARVTPAVAAVEPPAEEAEAPAGYGALARNSVPFPNPDGKPLLSVILVLDEQAAPDLDALVRLPFAVTFAVDPFRPGAAAEAQRLRAAGYEVAILASGLPKGANASDVEVTLAAHLAAIPEAVAVMEPSDGGFAVQRDLTRQALQILDAEGYGAIGWNRGLNALKSMAPSAGQPVALINRSLDDEGESAMSIERALDRAAFRAEQDGSVVLSGHPRPETLAALVGWATGDKAAQVAMAPVSAVLTAE